MRKTPAKRHIEKNDEEDSITESPEFEYATVSDDLPTRQPASRLTFFLSLVLIVAILIIGNLYTKVQQYEKGGAAIPTAGQPGTPPTGETKQVEVSDDDPYLGPKDAKVAVVIFEDFQCPYCGAFTGLNPEMVNNMKSRDPSWEPTVSNIKKDYVATGKVKLVWKDYPFLGEESYWSAEAARCAQDQGKFWEYHDHLFSHQNGENQGAFSKDNLKKFAQDLALNTTTFNDCLDTGKHQKKMQEAQAYGQGVGVSGTPGTFVNGAYTSGAASYSQIKAAIDKALQG